MEREIKFRFWSKGKPQFVSLHSFIASDGSKELVLRDFADPFNIDQFTGLTDKNGVEIYESDICRFYEDEEESIFFHGLAYINNDRVGGSWKIIQCDNVGGTEHRLDSSSFWNDDFEVIGNIHENPELLK